MSDSDVDPGGVGGVFKKISQLKDILVIGTLGLIGFGIGEVCVSIVWGVVLVFDLGDAQKASRDCGGYHPGDLIKKWGKAIGEAWHDFWN
jgi:hypothetical protein